MPKPRDVTRPIRAPMARRILDIACCLSTVRHTTCTIGGDIRIHPSCVTFALEHMKGRRLAMDITSGRGGGVCISAETLAAITPVLSDYMDHADKCDVRAVWATLLAVWPPVPPGSVFERRNRQ